MSRPVRPPHTPRSRQSRLAYRAPSRFGEALRGLPTLGHALPGVMVTEQLVGQRASGCALAAVIKACGKVKRTQQVPLLVPGGSVVPSVPRANVEAVKAIVADYRARIKEVVERAGLPHNLPPASEIRLQNLGVVAGPRKPALETAFKPMGYGCQGGSGVYHLPRRTSGNLTVVN